MQNSVHPVLSIKTRRKLKELELRNHKTVLTGNSLTPKHATSFREVVSIRVKSTCISGVSYAPLLHTPRVSVSIVPSSVGRVSKSCAILRPRRSRLIVAPSHGGLVTKFLNRITITRAVIACVEVIRPVASSEGNCRIYEKDRCGKNQSHFWLLPGFSQTVTQIFWQNKHAKDCERTF